MDLTETQGQGVTFVSDPSGWSEHRINEGMDWFEGKTGAPDIQSSFTNADDPVASIIALLSASAGVSNQREVWGAMISHVVWYMSGFKGVDALYSFLSGSEMYKKKFAYAVFPTLKDLGDLKSKSRNRAAFKTVIWFAGYGAAMYRLC